MVARRAHNPKVIGSNPVPATKPEPNHNYRLGFFMYAVYILYSFTFGQIYIGFTSNLIQRFYSHNSLGKKGWTIRYRPWEVIHVEYFEEKGEALKREQYLKSGQGRKYIREEIVSK